MCFLLPEKRASLPLDAACLRKPLTMIDSSKKQQQGFPEILTAEDFEPFKEKECLEGTNQKSLKEGQSVSGHAGRPCSYSCHLGSWHAGLPTTSVCLPSVCLLSVHCDPCTVQVLCGDSCLQRASADRQRFEWFAMGIRNLFQLNLS